MSHMAQSSRMRLLLLGLIALLSHVAVSLQVVGDEPTWNYDNHGTDWNIGDCNNTVDVQSPQALDENGVIKPSTFNDPIFGATVSFLTAWSEANITAENHGFSNYTYRINATNSNMGFFYAVEPFIDGPQTLWNVTQVSFHYPSEHTINGVQYDLEMQILMNDTLARATQWCRAGKATLSLFFNVGDAQDDDFWSWVGQDSFKFNLNKVFDKTTSIQSKTWAYMATGTQPPCTYGHCWYLNVPGAGVTLQRTITQETLDKLKYVKADGTTLAGNNRQTNQGAMLATFLYLDTGLMYDDPNPTPTPTTNQADQVPNDNSKAKTESAAAPDNTEL